MTWKGMSALNLGNRHLSGSQKLLGVFFCFNLFPGESVSKGTSVALLFSRVYNNMVPWNNFPPSVN